MKRAVVACVLWPMTLATTGSERASAASRRAVMVGRQAYLMGTVATLVTYAPTRELALSRLERILETLEATEAELSTWRPDSAVSRLNHAPLGHPQVLSPSLCRLFGELTFWHHYTGGLFDPALGRLLEAWDIHGVGRRATPEQIDAARARSGWGQFSLDLASCSLVRQTDATVDPGGFGKGEALDRVRTVLGGPSPTLVDLGGQVMAYGRPPNDPGWRIGIAHPRQRDLVVATVMLRGGSLSTSGGSERDLAVDEGRVGHILDPRSGRPANGDWSVLVWHPRALAADILSTALYVMGPDQGLGWAERRGVAACFLRSDSLSPGRSVRFWTTSAFRATLGRPQRF
jgi:thiamine biosynthesis lipoprotein